jgi:uncharacterized membrane protein YsdA (DUF1294 family)/cold shock CspA family protein
MRFEGVLKSWDDERGFGFIAPTQGGQEVFVHIKAFPRGIARPQLDQPLSFEVDLGPQGKKRAKNVQLVQVSKRRPLTERQQRAQWGTATLFVLPAFLVLLLVISVAWRPPLWLPGLYVVVSLMTFMAYAVDKSAAANDTWRTPENSLHLLALACGWPGALLAQQILRHKSTKAEFRRVFWATVLLNVAAFVLLCSPLGQPYWRPQ